MEPESSEQTPRGPRPRPPAPASRPPEAPVGPHVVEVSDTQAHLRVEPGWVAGLASRVLAREGVARSSISVALVDDAAIHALNRRHLDHDWPTDVISFALSEPGEPELTGELIVSAQMAAETARDAGAEPRAELALYVVHGLLHLCGYDDLDADDAAAMRRRQAEHLALEGLAAPDPPAGTGRGGAA